MYRQLNSQNTDINSTGPIETMSLPELIQLARKIRLLLLKPQDENKQALTQGYQREALEKWHKQCNELIDKNPQYRMKDYEEIVSVISLVDHHLEREIFYKFKLIANTTRDFKATIELHKEIAKHIRELLHRRNAWLKHLVVALKTREDDNTIKIDTGDTNDGTKIELHDVKSHHSDSRPNHNDLNLPLNAGQNRDIENTVPQTFSLPFELNDPSFDLNNYVNTIENFIQQVDNLLNNQDDEFLENFFKFRTHDPQLYWLDNPYVRSAIEKLKITIMSVFVLLKSVSSSALMGISMSTVGILPQISKFKKLSLAMATNFFDTALTRGPAMYTFFDIIYEWILKRDQPTYLKTPLKPLLQEKRLSNIQLFLLPFCLLGVLFDSLNAYASVSKLVEFEEEYLNSDYLKRTSLVFQLILTFSALISTITFNYKKYPASIKNLYYKCISPKVSYKDLSLGFFFGIWSTLSSLVLLGIQLLHAKGQLKQQFGITEIASDIICLILLPGKLMLTLTTQSTKVITGGLNPKKLSFLPKTHLGQCASFTLTAPVLLLNLIIVTFTTLGSSLYYFESQGSPTAVGWVISSLLAIGALITVFMFSEHPAYEHWAKCTDNYVNDPQSEARAESSNQNISDSKGPHFMRVSSIADSVATIGFEEHQLSKKIISTTTRIRLFWYCSGPGPEEAKALSLNPSDSQSIISEGSYHNLTN